MVLSDYFFVESTNLNEANCYKSIISDIISDLKLSSSINCLKVRIIPESSLYILVALLKKSENNIYIKDVCTLKFDFKDSKSFLIFEINQEKYIPELTNYLWCQFSRNLVVQVDRWKIEVELNEKNIDPNFINNFILENKSLTLIKNMLELSIRSAPEGFKVRYHYSVDQEFIFIASEEPITDNLINNSFEEYSKLIHQYNIVEG